MDALGVRSGRLPVCETPLAPSLLLPHHVWGIGTETWLMQQFESWSLGDVGSIHF